VLSPDELNGRSTSITALGPATDAGRAAVTAARGLRPFLAEQAVANDSAGRFAAASVSRLSEAGLLSVCAPVAAGGLGLDSLHDVSVLLKELAVGDGSVGVAVSMHLALAVYFARSGTTERQREWLAAIGRREMVLASAVAEAGTEAWRVMTTARKAPGGWSVSGQKILVSNSPGATHFYTRLRAETGSGYAMATAMVPASATGVVVLDDWRGLGLRGSGSGRVRFDDVFVPDAALRVGGRWGEPDPTDFEGRAAASIPIVATYLGMAETAHRAALRAYARAAEAPGRGRADSVAVRWLVSDMAIAMAEATAVFRCVLSDIDSVFAGSVPRSADPVVGRDLLRDCLIASLVVERAAYRVVDAAMQVCGGGSYLAGHELERVYRDVKAAAFMRPFSPPERYVEFLGPEAVAA